MYQIVYCFTDSKGIIETDENGEVIYTDLIDAKSGNEALNKLYEKENFKQIPDILDIKEVSYGSN